MCSSDLTALSACIGLFPAAISHGIGSQVQRPLATVVVGGMIIGPILLLLIVPTLNFEILRRIKPKKLDVEPEEPHEV